MSEKLKRCPFCGGKAEHHNFVGKHLKIYSVRCRKCRACRSSEKSEEDAIILWNKRVSKK